MLNLMAQTQMKMEDDVPVPQPPESQESSPVDVQEISDGFPGLAVCSGVAVTLTVGKGITVNITLF